MPASTPLATSIYNLVFKRNAVFVPVIFTTAFFFEIAFETYTNKLFDTINAGKQWKDIKHRYIEQDDE